MKNLPSTLLGLVFLAIAIIFFLSLISYDPQDISFLSYPSHIKTQNLIGITGAYCAAVLFFLFGYGSYFIPWHAFLLALDNLGVVRVEGVAKGVLVRIFSYVLLCLAICTLLGFFPDRVESVYANSGLFGTILSQFLLKYFGFWGAFISTGILIVILAWLLVGLSLVDLFLHIGRGIVHIGTGIISFIKNSCGSSDVIEEKRKKPALERAKITRERFSKRAQESSHKSVPEIKVYTPSPASESIDGEFPVSPRRKIKKGEDQNTDVVPEDEGITPFDPKSYKIPPIGILKTPVVPDSRKVKENIEHNIKNLEDTLVDFGVRAKVVSVQKGPVVTMYELQPYSGVKIQRITTLSDDIALAMKSSSVRIEAPLPGRGTIGIEIPNLHKHLVSLREVLEEKAFSAMTSKLTLAIGKDVSGNPVVADLKSMPHLLIAGTTGAGKTVCVNSIIASILFKAKPDEVKLILVDPKKVELAPFGGIPHLIHPIISDRKKVFAVLNWAVEEMESRYKLLAEEGTRNIDLYNKKKFRMPFIIIVIDELADLMATAKDKIETAIQRLAQLSRAVGIHLILATQRPSVDVITGIIKANFPARISFKVSSKVDSRTVLDMIGADKLLGKGDLLFIRPGFLKAVRVQGSYIDDEDIETLTNFVRAQGGPIYEDRIKESQKSTESLLGKDELLDEAMKIVLTNRQASASLLQRRLRVGYTRAARLLDLMEEEGIVGPFCGSKAREILVDPVIYLKERNL